MFPGQAGRICSHALFWLVAESNLVDCSCVKGHLTLKSLDNDSPRLVAVHCDQRHVRTAGIHTRASAAEFQRVLVGSRKSRFIG